MKQIDVKDVESWREYEFGGRVYRIESPVRVWIGGTTHRVEGPDGVIHCVPAPGFRGCVLRWFGGVIA